MRPRHKAAENPCGMKAKVVRPSCASMRPRHKAAENDDKWKAGLTSEKSFNEAAA